MKKHIEPPKENYAKIIVNHNGKIIEHESKINLPKDVDFKFIDADFSCETDPAKLEEMTPLCNCVPSSISDKEDNTGLVSIKPVFDYAYSVRDNAYVQIGVDSEDTGKRKNLWQIFDDGTVSEFDGLAFIGDEVGPLGLFVPFTASTSAIGAAGKFFADIYDSRIAKLKDK